MKSSHEYARAMLATAEYILARPDVDFDVEHRIYLHFWNKEQFINAAKAMGTCKKEFASDELVLKIEGAPIEIRAPRNLVCRKIQEAKFVCEPLMSDRELEALGEKPLQDIPF